MRLVPLDGWFDDAGRMQFAIEVEADQVRIELPYGRHGVVTIWPYEARALAEALLATADEVVP